MLSGRDDGLHGSRLARAAPVALRKPHDRITDSKHRGLQEALACGRNPAALTDQRQRKLRERRGGYRAAVGRGR